MTGFLLLIDQKSNNNDIILVVVNCLIKMVYYKSVRTTKDATTLAKVFINMMIKYHSFLRLIINNQNSLFIAKFWFLLLLSQY